MYTCIYNALWWPQILVVMALLTRIVGLLPALAGLLVSCALVPFSALVGRALAAVRKQQMRATDRRVKLTSEVVIGAEGAGIWV